MLERGSGLTVFLGAGRGLTLGAGGLQRFVGDVGDWPLVDWERVYKEC